MEACILMGSPRRQGNTAALLDPLVDTLERGGCRCDLIWLYDKSCKPCTACRACQSDWSIFGCGQNDDLQDIFDRVLRCDLLILATPIYSWYCTPPMKAVLDRLVYGMNKYYGREKGPSLWSGKPLALVATCGYPAETGADLWESGMIRYCKHSQLRYLGMLAQRHKNYQTPFMDEEKAEQARAFAGRLLSLLSSSAP